jgi:hypothetical protein
MRMAQMKRSAQLVMCAVCGWPIKAHRTRAVTDSDTVCCLRCVLERPTAAHTAAYPDCRLAWHSVLDHNLLFHHRRMTPTSLE